MKSMSKWKRILIFALPILLVSLFGIQRGIQIFRDGAQAYLYGYSLVLMNATKESMTDSGQGKVPLNHFSHVQYFPDHHFRQVVRPNNDTLYSTAWLDVSQQPLVLSVPAMADRYYVMPLMDAWTNVFASVGTRTTGTEAGVYVIVGPNWQGDAPADLPLIRSPTNLIWLIGRIQTNTESDFEYIAQLQAQFTLTPLNVWGAESPNQGYFIDQSEPSSATDNPAAMVEGMSPGEFFHQLARLMAEQPAANIDRPMLQTLADFGIVPGKPFEMEQLGFFRRTLLQKSVTFARDRLRQAAVEDRSSENGWAVVRDGVGVYGDQYHIRGFVSSIGLGALTPEEAAYPNSQRDSNGNPLSGQHRYRIRFEPGKTPPVNAFWSLTVYDENGFLIDNPIKRYAIGDRDALQFNDDGSLEILIQHERPGGDISNWLPSPPDAFAVTMRLYMPQPGFLDGSWKLPAIERVK
jgi:hypothetical protein